MTTEPKDPERKIRLQRNPDSSDKRISFLRIKPVTANKKYYSAPKSDWSFSKEDQAIVRHLKKDYKKRAYRNKKKKK